MPTEEILSRSPAETRVIGQRLAEELAGGGVVWLEGPLGAGKTLLAKAIFGALGADPARVTSPTFTLINRYRSRTHPGLALWHVDLYRIDRPAEIDSIGLEELFEPGAVVVIEWAEKLGPGWERPSCVVHLADEGDDLRRVRIERAVQREDRPSQTGRS